MNSTGMQHAAPYRCTKKQGQGGHQSSRSPSLISSVTLAASSLHYRVLVPLLLASHNISTSQMVRVHASTSPHGAGARRSLRGHACGAGECPWRSRRPAGRRRRRAARHVGPQHDAGAGSFWSRRKRWRGPRLRNLQLSSGRFGTPRRRRPARPVPPARPPTRSPPPPIHAGSARATCLGDEFTAGTSGTTCSTRMCCPS